MRTSLCTLGEDELNFRLLQAGDLPPLPGAIHRLMEIIHDEMGSQAELESILRYDQALSAKVLRLANSSFYGCRSEIKTLSRAILTVGYEKVRSICLCTLLMELLADKKALDRSQREAFWKHSFATARIASVMAAKRPWMNKEEAYILGLLHDLGEVAMAVYFSEEYKYIHDLAQKRKVPRRCVEFQYGLSHTQIGKWLSTKWAFPEIFRRVLEFHHEPEESPSFVPELKMIYLADVLAGSRELPEFLDDNVSQSYCRDLFIDEDEWAEHREGLEAIWPEVDQLWNVLG